MKTPPASHLTPRVRCVNWMASWPRHLLAFEENHRWRRSESGLWAAGEWGRHWRRDWRNCQRRNWPLCTDPVPEQAAKLAAERGARVAASLSRLVGDDRVEAVIVPAPQFAHAKATVAAAKAGKHVFCEKPMAVSLGQCDAMIEACQAAGVKLMIGQVCRYHPTHGKVKELAASGDFGKPISMTVHRLGGSWGGAYCQPWRLA